MFNYTLEHACVRNYDLLDFKLIIRQILEWYNDQSYQRTWIYSPNSEGVDFENAVQEAHRPGLLQFAGLEEFHFVRGIRGAQGGCYGTIWIYEGNETLEMLWGSVVKPLSRRDYPEKWKIWEQKALSQFLEDDPDKIRFTVYEEF